jgi:2-methylisocitrate lyase-like PEP mutase family enzyme
LKDSGSASLPSVPFPRRLENTVRRAQAYLEAGADSIFPIVVPDNAIAPLVRAIKAPINIIVVPGIPAIGKLERLGVARVSFGSGPMRSAMSVTRRIAEELLSRGTYTTLMRETIPTAEMNRLMPNRR